MSEAELWREIKRLQATVDAMQSAERPLFTDFNAGLDLTRTPLVYIATNTTYVFSTTNFRGLVLISEAVNYGGFACFAFDGGNSVEMVDTINMYSPTVGTANMINVYIGAGIPTVENKKALTAGVRINPIRNT